MAPAKRKAQQVALSEPIDFGDKPPIIVTLGSDLSHSRRLQAQLSALRKQYGLPEPVYQKRPE